MDPSQVTSLTRTVRLHLKNHCLIFFECREGLVGFERRTGCQKNGIYGEYRTGLSCIPIENMNIRQFCPYLPLTGCYGTKKSNNNC